MKKKTLIILIIILCFLGIGGIVLFALIETKDVEEQEMISQLLAEEYLVSMTQKSEGKDENETPTEDGSDFDYEDNEIYGKYTEEGAWGHIDSVLEIPAIDFRQSIFSGTVGEIQHDLRNWLSVTARADYILGDTHYCIYIHNPRNKSIKISQAQDKIVAGDYMVLTKGEYVYLYEILDMFSEWREKCTAKFVDNMELENDMLYIFTCGRDEWQYKNLVIEGKVYEKYKISDWNEKKDEYVKEYKTYIAEKENVVEKEKMIMSIAVNDNDKIVVSLTTENYKTVYDCSVGVFDENGYLIEDIENPIYYDGYPIEIPKLKNGTYCIGVYENNSDFEIPLDYEITVSSGEEIYDIHDVVGRVEEGLQIEQYIKYIAIGMFSCSVIMGIIIFVRVRKEDEYDEEIDDEE